MPNFEQVVTTELFYSIEERNNYGVRGERGSSNAKHVCRLRPISRSSGLPTVQRHPREPLRSHEIQTEGDRVSTGSLIKVSRRREKRDAVCLVRSTSLRRSFPTTAHTVTSPPRRHLRQATMTTTPSVRPWQRRPRRRRHGNASVLLCGNAEN